MECLCVYVCVYVSVYVEKKWGRMEWSPVDAITESLGYTAATFYAHLCILFYLFKYFFNSKSFIPIF